MSRRARASAPRSGQDRLVATVRRLQAEVEGLRRVQRRRAVIEQAKGLLVGRLGCSPDEAFAHLSQISQQSNMKVIEVAAGLLGIAAPAPAAAAAPGPEPFRPERYVRMRPGAPGPADAAPSPAAALLGEESTARYHLACAAVASVDDARELAETAWAEGLRHLGVTAVVLGILEPDGAVRLVSTHGLARTLASAWQRVPSNLNVAFLKAVANGRPLWINRAEAAEQGYELLGDGELRGCLPLYDRGRVFGVASVIWSRGRLPDPTVRAYVGAVVEACGRRMSQLLHRADGTAIASPAAHWVESVLETLPGSFALLSPVRDDSGEVLDWRFDRCSPEAADAAGRTADQISGRRLLDLYPHAGTNGVFDGYLHTLRTGEPFRLGPALTLLAGDRHDVPAVMSVRASRFGDGVLVHWRYHDVERRLISHLDRVQRLGDVGWAEWNLVTGDDTWSAQTYRILRRDPGKGPVKLSALVRYAVPEDAAGFADAIQRLTRAQEPIAVSVRLHRDGRQFPVRFVADPVTDGRGRLVAVHAAVRRIAGGVGS
jgi:hypothetical protein